MNHYAPGVLVGCGDYRISHWRDQRIIQVAIDRLAVQLGFMQEGDEDFPCDRLTTPGPVVPMSKAQAWIVSGSRVTPEMMREAEMLVDQIKMYLSLHKGELVICLSHFDCGREAENGRNRKILLKHLRAMGRYVRGEIGRKHKVGLIFVEVRDGKTVDAIPYLLKR